MRHDGILCENCKKSSGGWFLELANTKRYANRTRKGMSYVIRKRDMVVIAVERLKWKGGRVQLCKERCKELQ